MSECQSNLPPGRIQFHQWCQPPIDPGDYTVSVHQTVAELETEGAFDNTFEFSVAGPRFSLNPSEVYSVYPPKGGSGDFASTLPHVVFTRRTLPWERSVTTVRDDLDRRPWMALMVFSASDFESKKFPDIVSRKVKDLINPGDNDDWVGPCLVSPHGLQTYESPDDLCTTVDIPWDVFQATAPSYADLDYLAHVREINTDNKETASFLADGWFSVVLANRFPEPERPFLATSLGDVASFVKKLRAPNADHISQFLWTQFSIQGKNLLGTSTASVEDQRSVLLDELNRIVRGKSIYDGQLFPEASLSKETVELRDKPPQGSEVAHFNKLLLEDAYRREIVKRPPAAVENRAYLVSLEGLADYLPMKPAAHKPVRLAVLSSWTFHCREAFTFKSSMVRLDAARIGVPWNGGPEGASPDAKDLVRKAYEWGYTALNHSTRLGEKAVSWYRGPLVPLYLTKQTTYDFRPAADAALRYDPLEGMLDVTYAGAFQLGRLLALQDRHFATSLYAYRTRVQRRLNDVQSKKRLESVLGKSTDGRGHDIMERDIMSCYLGKVNGSPGSSSANGWATSAPGIADPSKPDDPGNSLRVTNDFGLTFPKTVCQWLGRLMLLYRVPFSYLVPDERMLPTESIRFFYLDPGWLKCLLEGACSVGRASSRDELVDKELRDHFLDYAIQESQKVRTRSPETGAADPLEIQVLPTKGPGWLQLTGFLLRSSVVEGWQGLEMRAWEKWKPEWTDAENAEKTEKVLKPLRIDRLGPDIMLCIFPGEVNHIEIKQPPEGMHFGATKDVAGNGYTRLSLRRLNEDGAAQPGDQIDGTKTTVNLRNDPTRRVVDIVGLARDLKTKLKPKQFTSAEFGVEMVESAGRVIFEVPPKRGSR